MSIALRWDAHAQMSEALRSGLGRAAAATAGSIEAQRAPRLMVVAYADPWAPPAHSTAVAVEQVRMGGDVQAFAQIFLLDAMAEREAAYEAGIVSTPAILFYWDGEPVIVRRPLWEDDTKFTGAITAERLVEIIRHARDCCAKGVEESTQLIVTVDF